jgi:glutamine synthetase
MAPTFEEAVIAVDHNLLTMDVLHKVAHRHGLKVLFHEKPFTGINGSGKHCNWSMSTDHGENLLNPTDNPEENLQFLLFLVATLQAVHKYAGLLRASISSSSNEYRLGAHEAPPGIISVFLGEHLNEVLNSIEENRPLSRKVNTDKTQIKLGGAGLDVQVSTLPEIARDLTDRNRTSPFAFTGNKFEFRAVGAKQSPAFPMALLNAAVSCVLHDISDQLEKAKGSKETPSKEEILTLVKSYIKSSKNVRMEGDNYSEAWVKEAERRGLLNISTCPEAFKQLLVNDNIKALTERVHVFTQSELNSR